MDKWERGNAAAKNELGCRIVVHVDAVCDDDDDETTEHSRGVKSRKEWWSCYLQ